MQSSCREPPNVEPRNQRRATANAAFRTQLHAFGLEPGTLFGDDFQKFHLDEIKRWGQTLPTLGIKGLV